MTYAFPMTDIAARNRQIKKTLEQAFGRGKVSVRGDRGTAYGWVDVKINHTPRTWEVARELRAHVMALLDAAKIQIGRYDSGDYGAGREIHIGFNSPQHGGVFTPL
jgi:hypothetical protein